MRRCSFGHHQSHAPCFHAPHYASQPGRQSPRVNPRTTGPGARPHLIKTVRFAPVRLLRQPPAAPINTPCPTLVCCANSAQRPCLSIIKHPPSLSMSQACRTACRQATAALCNTAKAAAAQQAWRAIPRSCCKSAKGSAGQKQRSQNSCCSAQAAGLPAVAAAKPTTSSAAGQSKALQLCLAVQMRHALGQRVHVHHFVLACRSWECVKWHISKSMWADEADLAAARVHDSVHVHRLVLACSRY